MQMDGAGIARGPLPVNATRALATISPGGPRGGTADAADLKSAARIAEKHAATPENTERLAPLNSQAIGRLGILLGAIPENDRDFVRLRELWPLLSQAIRSSILSLVMAAVEKR